LRKTINNREKDVNKKKLFDALKLMAEKDLESLVVVEKEKVVGILSERD
jgi:CBS domain-containing protein